MAPRIELGRVPEMETTKEGETTMIRSKAVRFKCPHCHSTPDYILRREGYRQAPDGGIKFDNEVYWIWPCCDLQADDWNRDLAPNIEEYDVLISNKEWARLLAFVDKEGVGSEDPGQDDPSIEVYGIRMVNTGEEKGEWAEYDEEVDYSSIKKEVDGAKEIW